MPVLHLEDPDLFREAVQFTGREMALSPALVEKDYFCSMVLQGLADLSPPLTFKGGTALAKVHIGFYRMSEDLDFSIPLAENAPRSERSRAAARVGGVLEGVARSAGADVTGPWTGSNGSRQYGATLSYRSLVDGALRTIQVEVGLREPLLSESESLPVRTMLLDPVSRAAATPAFEIRALSLPEAVAEKFRAALTRRIPAIRDFYDIDVIAQGANVRVSDPEFLNLLRAKQRVKGTGAVDLSASRLAQLRAQIPFDLVPMLPGGNVDGFDLDRAFMLAKEVAGKL